MNGKCPIVQILPAFWNRPSDHPMPGAWLKRLKAALVESSHIPGVPMTSHLQLPLCQLPGSRGNPPQGEGSSHSSLFEGRSCSFDEQWLSCLQDVQFRVQWTSQSFQNHDGKDDGSKIALKLHLEPQQTEWTQWILSSSVPHQPRYQVCLSWEGREEAGEGICTPETIIQLHQLDCAALWLTNPVQATTGLLISKVVCSCGNLSPK